MKIKIKKLIFVAFLIAASISVFSFGLFKGVSTSEAQACAPIKLISCPNDPANCVCGAGFAEAGVARSSWFGPWYMKLCVGY